MTCAALSALNARSSASLASRARSSGDLLPRAACSVNTGVSPRRTTAAAAAGDAEALGAGAALLEEAMDGAAGTLLAAGRALGAGSGGAVGADGGASGASSGSALTEASAEGASAAGATDATTG